MEKSARIPTDSPSVGRGRSRAVRGARTPRLRVRAAVRRPKSRQRRRHSIESPRDPFAALPITPFRKGSDCVGGGVLDAPRCGLAPYGGAYSPTFASGRLFGARNPANAAATASNLPLAPLDPFAKGALPLLRGSAVPPCTACADPPWGHCCGRRL
jgi:hypothetical protein